MKRFARRLALPVLGIAALASAGPAFDEGTSTAAVRWKQHDMRRPKPAVVRPAAGGAPQAPPGHAVVLFDGSGLDAWKSTSGGKPGWAIVDGCLQTVPGAGAIETKQHFGDVQLHIEWSAPRPPRGVGQDRGNSGVFLMGQFEVQVLDSFQADTYADGQAGSIYGQYPPLFNASRPPGEWQTFDVAFRRPRFDPAGKLVEPARITLFHNGVLVQDNEEPFGPTSWLKWGTYTDLGGRGPISLQDHDHPVRYRNVWLCEVPERPAPGPRELARPKTVKLGAAALDRFAGKYRLGDGPNAALATFTREDDHLMLSLPFRAEPLAALPVSETEFDLPYTDGEFTFQVDASGRVTGVHFRVGDGARDWKRVGP